MKGRGIRSEKKLTQTVQNPQSKPHISFFKLAAEHDWRELYSAIPATGLPEIADLEPLTEADLANPEKIRALAKTLVTSYWSDVDSYDFHHHLTRERIDFETRPSKPTEPWFMFSNSSIMNLPERQPIDFEMDSWPTGVAKAPLYWPTTSFVQREQSHPVEYMPVLLNCCLVFVDETVFARFATIKGIMSAELVDSFAQSCKERFTKKREELIHDPKFQEFVRAEGDSVLAILKKYYQDILDKKTRKPQTLELSQTIELYRDILGKLDGAYDDLKKMIHQLANTSPRLTL